MMDFNQYYKAYSTVKLCSKNIFLLSTIKPQFNKLVNLLKNGLYFFYLKPTAACQTKANKRKSTGIAGIISTIGRNAAYASGRYDIRKFTFILLLTLYI